MDINLVIMADGTMALAVPEGEYEEASLGLKDFIKTLEVGDIPIVTTGDEPEMHKKMQKFVDAKVQTRR